MSDLTSKPVVLAILDGWGVSPKLEGNAILKADLKFYPTLTKNYLYTTLSASGEAVGLPHSEDGNTETGHLNIGAGSIVYQDLPRINQSIANGEFYNNESLNMAVTHATDARSTLHLIGLIGASSVHSNLEHLYALLNLCQRRRFSQVSVHAITDGRDSPPTAGINYLHQVNNRLKKNGFGQLATIMGRYYAMDRDNNWDRIQVAYEALTRGVGEYSTDFEKSILAAYHEQITDEFIKPIILTDESQNPLSLISANDAVIFFNYRVDRPRQLTKAFTLPNLSYLDHQHPSFDPYAVKYHGSHLAKPSQAQTFERGGLIPNLFFVTMTEYEKGLPVNVAFPPETIESSLSLEISNHGLRQLKMAETEKERFVTYYFNGQREDPFPGEDRIIIPSPPVPTYNEKPDMSAHELTDTLIERIHNQTYDLIVVNYANADMVGHTGNFEATILALRTLDQVLEKLVKAILEVGGTLCITADHGNAEEMLDLQTGQVSTKHTTNPVPFIVVGEKLKSRYSLSDGILGDIAPTILQLMGLPIPANMTGRPLLKAL